MRRFLLLLVAGILLLIVQTTGLSFFPTERMWPDLLLIFTLYLAFLFPPFLGGILAFFFGFLVDLFSGNTVGVYAFSRTLVFFATQFLKERFYLEGISFQFLFAFAFSVLEGGLLHLLINRPEPASFENLFFPLFTFLLPRSFCTGLVAPFFFYSFQKGMPLFTSQPEQGIKTRG